jgi:hypothetical protein
MPEFDRETWGWLVFAAYFLIGLPIAWHFMRKQNMEASAKQSGQERLVVTVLTIMWPVLLFALAVDRLRPPAKAAKNNRKSQDDKKPPE